MAFRLTHKTARGVLIATDHMATNTYWMVTPDHPAHAAAVTRLGGNNRQSMHFTSWGECEYDANPSSLPYDPVSFLRSSGGFDGDDPLAWPHIDPAATRWTIHPDFEPVADGYIIRAYRTAKESVTFGLFGIFNDGGLKLVGIIMGRKPDPFWF